MPKDIDEARKKALRFLQYRPRSGNEVRQKLRRQEFSPDTIERIINELSADGLLDDSVFARAWAEERLLSKRLGFRKIRQELAQKGIPGETADAVMADLASRYNEIENAQAYLEQKFRNRLSGQEKQKLIDSLLRAGYSTSAAQDAVKSLSR